MAQQYLGLILTLFILSMICERLADFLKSFLSDQNPGWGLWLKRALKIGNLQHKEPADSIAESKRAYRILKVNIFCGFATAWALHADLFTIIEHSEKPFEAIGWKHIVWFWEDGFVWEASLLGKAIAFIGGCFATGFFISFGSKFWHDLLDIIYQVKNYKRLLADPETYRIDNIASLDKAISVYQSDFIRAAFLEAKSKYMAMANVKAISLKYDTQGYYFELSVKQVDASIGTFYQYTLENGTIQSVRLQLMVLGGDDILAHTADLSNKIFDTNTTTSFGTLGCLVRSNEPGDTNRYILTCCHNIMRPASDLSQFKPGTISAGTNDDQANPIGMVEKAVRDHEIDAALIKIDADKIKKIRNSMPRMGPPKSIRSLSKADRNRVSANICGAGSSFQSGVVVSVYCDVKVTYSMDEFQLINLVAISNGGKAISKRGDSGSVVFDQNNDVLGLVVAGSSTETYMIPIDTLFQKLNVQLA